MAKNIDDMIVPERKRSIRDIPIPEGRKRGRYTSAPSEAPVGAMRDIEPVQDFRQSAPVPPPPPPRMPKMPSRGKSRKKWWLIGAVVVVALAFLTISFFDTSTLTYVPKSTPVSFTGESFAASKSGANGLSFSVAKFTSDKSVEVPATEEQQVERKASGTIIVYNNHSSQAERFVVNTRFETPEGLIYRALEPISVPGKTSSGPGSVEIRVAADQPGAEYNIGLTDFTVPGLAGTPRASTIYARSKTSMTGGFVGVERAVSDSEKSAALSGLESSLRDDLYKLAEAQVPEGFILIPDLSFVSFEEMPQTPSASGTNSVNLNLRGNLFGVMFKTTELSTAISEEKAQIAEGESVNVVGLENLSFAYTGEEPTDLLSAEEISFSVSGGGVAVWKTDEVALKTDLLGRKESDLPSILSSSYPTVVSASTQLRPFWRKSFPENGEDLIIKQLPASQ